MHTSYGLSGLGCSLVWVKAMLIRTRLCKQAVADTVLGWAKRTRPFFSIRPLLTRKNGSHKHRTKANTIIVSELVRRNSTVCLRSMGPSVLLKAYLRSMSVWGQWRSAVEGSGRRFRLLLRVIVLVLNLRRYRIITQPINK